MSERPSAPSPEGAFSPKWASVLASIAAVVALGCFALAVWYAWLFFSGEQYGVLGLLLALVLAGLGLFVGGPTLGYFRTRRRGMFVTSMVCAGLVVAGVIAFLLYAAG